MHMFEVTLTFLHSRHVDVDLAVVMSADLVGRLASQQLIGQLRQHVNHPLVR